MARAFRGHLDALVRHVAAPHEKLAYGAVLLSLGAEIDVGEDLLGVLKQMEIVGALEPVGNRTEDAQPNAFGLGIADKAQSFVHEFQIETWISRHLSHNLASAIYRRTFHGLRGLSRGRLSHDERGAGKSRPLLLLYPTDASVIQSGFP